MKFKQIAIENFRPYYNKQTLPFSISKGKPVTLIQAPNQWGKTSVYEAIKWCLYDIWPDVEDRGPSINIEQLAKYNKSKKPFDVAVTIDFNHDNTNYRVFRSFTYTVETNEKKPDSKLYISSVSSTGNDQKLEHIHDYQLFIDNLLPQDISKYFIVDGDDFKGFINPTGSKTKEAIEHLLNLKIFDRVRQHLGTLEKDFQGNFARKSGSKDAKELAEKVKKADEILTKLQEEEKKLQGDLDLAYTQWKRYDKKLQEATLSSKKIDEINILERENRTAEEQKKLLINECRKRFSQFYTFMLKHELNVIYDTLVEIREPLDISPYDRVLLQDIIKLCDKEGHVDCLCGSGIKKGDPNYKSIKEKLETLAGVSHKNEVLELQTQLNETIKNIPKRKKEIQDYEVSLLKIDQKLEKNNGLLKSLRQEIDETAGQNAAAMAKQTVQAEKDYKNIKLDHAVKEESIRNHTEAIDKDRKELQKSLNVDERTKKLKMKLDLVGNAYKAVEAKYEVYRLKKRKELQTTVQKILFKMLTADKMFESFTIDDDYEYDVISKKGKSWKRNMSNGQRKVLGVSFVAGLKNVANEDAPYIIDSPLNAVDAGHQKNYAKILPDLSTQLILFVTDAELTTVTYNLLKPKIGKASKIDWSAKDDYYRSKFVEWGV